MWEESKHPRDNDGRFTAKNGTPAEHKRLRELGIKEDYKMIKDRTIQKLVNVLEKVKKVKIKELHNYIRNLKPVKLKINQNEIIAQFDKYSADKNIYTIGNSDKEGFNEKLKNIKKLPEYIETSNYSNSKKEKGKTIKQHKDVKQWHYFINQVKTDNGEFDITVNVRDKGENKYVYEVSFKKKQ